MTRPRSQIISIQATPYYHCISRCVRRAFLCGDDHYSGNNFDHRKPWLLERMALLEEVFAIEIAAYAVMSNHYHLVLHVNTKQADNWSREEVIHRWRKLFKGPALIHRYLDGDSLSDVELLQIEAIVSTWKARLCNISWFMSNLNENIARQANKEDGCTGRFWEGRFKSQALLDEAALLSCMAYVDLNPIRAGLATDLQTSNYTSIHDRLRQFKSRKSESKVMPTLMSFSEVISKDQSISTIPFSLKHYIDLVDWSGRCVRGDKKGSISSDVPKVLNTLALTSQQWKYLSLEIQKKSYTMLNGLEKIQISSGLKKYA